MAAVPGGLASGELSALDFRPLLQGEWGQLTAQHWGIAAGVTTYVLTVTVVLVLLVKGGTLRRLREQADAFEEQGPAAFAAPATRFELYDELLAAAKTLPRKPVLPLSTVATAGDEVAKAGLRGKHVELRPYVPSEHLEHLFSISNGAPCFDYGAYDPESEIWRFFAQGPFAQAADLGAAPFMDDAGEDGARYVVVDRNSGFIVGMASLLHNCPSSLRIELGDVWLTPAFQRTHVHTDVCLTLLRHLLKASCYRRVEWRCDAQNAKARKAAERAGFTLEGLLHKHMVVRSCNRDTALFAITNSDWRDGGEDMLAAKLRPPTGIAGPSRAAQPGPPRGE